ncbi:hypothetical protein [Demequina sp. NBRC 110052]|uniref:hypothetical protein n=1 Tax=Demequina sp. NBRC 110052 TaxID=1570341 RepID=UPI00135629E1|nr:hypothetical protein [Demequina sp. NBRC 110052]
MDTEQFKDKAKDALPDDETVENAAEKVRENTPDEVDVNVAKAEQWTKDHNKD